MSEDQVMPSNTPTSWRDVYQLVQDSEKRLTTTITDGFTRQQAVSQDHEVRIRVLEANDQRDGATNRAAAAAIGVTRSTVLAAISILSLIVAVTSVILK